MTELDKVPDEKIIKFVADHSLFGNPKMVISAPWYIRLKYYIQNAYNNFFKNRLEAKLEKQFITKEVPDRIHNTYHNIPNELLEDSLEVKGIVPPVPGLEHCVDSNGNIKLDLLPEPTLDYLKYVSKKVKVKRKTPSFSIDENTGDILVRNKKGKMEKAGDLSSPDFELKIKDGKLVKVEKGK